MLVFFSESLMLVLFSESYSCSIRVEERKWKGIRIEEVLGRNSGLV